MSDEFDQLVERYVLLGQQRAAIEAHQAEVKAAMRRALLASGHDANPSRPRSSAKAASKSAATRHAARMTAARDEEQKILSILTERPYKTIEIIQATNALASSTNERLRRLKNRGSIVRTDDGWSLPAVSPATSPG
jgi:hypothetical protein